MWFLNTEVSPCQFFSSHEHEGQRKFFTDLAPRDLSIFFFFNHKTLLLTNLSRLPFLDAKRDRMKLYWYDVTEKLRQEFISQGGEKDKFRNQKLEARKQLICSPILINRKTQLG